MSDNKLPYVRWFPSDYLAAIRGMRSNEVGIYTILLNEMYERCEPLPNNVEMLSRRCGTSKAIFKSVLKMLIAEKKIIVIDEKLWNKRVEKEFKFRRTRSQSSKRAAEIRWEKHNEINDDVMQPQCESNANGMREACVEDAKPETRNQKPERIKIIKPFFFLMSFGRYIRGRLARKKRVKNMKLLCVILQQKRKLLKPLKCMQNRSRGQSLLNILKHG